MKTTATNGELRDAETRWWIRRSISQAKTHLPWILNARAAGPSGCQQLFAVACGVSNDRPPRRPGKNAFLSSGTEETCAALLALTPSVMAQAALDEGETAAAKFA